MTAFTTVTGRLVFGNPFKAEPLIDDVTKQPKRDSAGNPLSEYVVGVAFPKGDPAVTAMLATFKAADRAAWPAFHDVAGNLLPGVVFADKITDGDGYNKKGAHYGARDGWAGHWVIRFVSRFAPTCYAWEQNGWVQVTDPNAIKPGYFVQVSGTTVSNGSAQSPGMYRNLNQIARIAYGPEIVRAGADPNAAFGSAAPTLPPGASAHPVAPATPVPGAAYAAPAPAAAPPPAAYVAPPPAPPVPAAAPPPPPPAAPVRVMLPAAEGQTYEALIAAGWTDDLLVQHGKMAP